MRSENMSENILTTYHIPKIVSSL